MSTFELQPGALGGPRSRSRGAGQGLASCASTLRRLADRLSNQHGFGIETVLSNVNACAASASELSQAPYAIAAFLDDLQGLVTASEDEAYSILSGTQPEKKSLTDLIAAINPGIAAVLSGASKLPPWAAAFGESFFKEFWDDGLGFYSIGKLGASAIENLFDNYILEKAGGAAGNYIGIMSTTSEIIRDALNGEFDPSELAEYIPDVLELSDFLHDRLIAKNPNFMDNAWLVKKLDDLCLEGAPALTRALKELNMTKWAEPIGDKVADVAARASWLTRSWGGVTGQAIIKLPVLGEIVSYVADAGKSSYTNTLAVLNGETSLVGAGIKFGADIYSSFLYNAMGGVWSLVGGFGGDAAGMVGQMGLDAMVNTMTGTTDGCVDGLSDSIEIGVGAVMQWATDISASAADLINPGFGQAIREQTGTVIKDINPYEYFSHLDYNVASNTRELIDYANKNQDFIPGMIKRGYLPEGYKVVGQ